MFFSENVITKTLQRYHFYLELQKFYYIFAVEMKKTIIILILILLSLHGFAITFGGSADYTRTYPLHEIRAVWLTTIGGLDWPHSYAQSSYSAERQKNELRSILDKLNHAGINVVMVQTRVRATTIYNSKYEPWDGALSGNPGKSPGYDALEFVIDECHKRGMQCHAWVVCIPVGKWNGYGCKVLRARYPNLIKKIGDEGFMNPENPNTADYIAGICREITFQYDVDGIHLDYIRYPETWGRINNKDVARNYISGIVEKVWSSVKEEKKWVMVSCSPIGKYGDLARQWSHGWNARETVCQDAAAWLQKGWMDALFPMMYFKDQNFYPFAVDWQERSCGRFVVPGLGIYFLSPKEKNWKLGDITREMEVCRQMGIGYAFFRSKFFTDNTKGLYNFTANNFAPYPSLVPPMTWYEHEAPNVPQVRVRKNENRLTQEISWIGGEDNSDGNYLTYNVYASESYPVDTKDCRNLIIRNTREKKTTVTRRMNYAVTAVDRYGFESVPAMVKRSEINPVTIQSKGTAGLKASRAGR